MHLSRLFACLPLLLVACDGSTPGTEVDAAAPMEDAGTPPPGLREGGPVTYAPVYDAVTRNIGGDAREWIPTDLSVHPDGALWVVQRLERDPAFDDDSECTGRHLATGGGDCLSLEGSTVAISDPAAAELASSDNGRAALVIDGNAWHFMRRPSGIAFGAAELSYGPDDPGASEAGVTDTMTFEDTFATCHEHWTGNPTDANAFIGPSLWSADPSIYGQRGEFSWSNGSHLDMVHATQYCMGIAHERDNVYWTFNGAEGVLDRYDFGAPHYPGHSDHDDGEVTRFDLGAEGRLARLEGVPSNMVVVGQDLFLSDTGNGRVMRVDMDSPTTLFGNFMTFEMLEGEYYDGIGFEVILDRAALEAEWGGASEPSGLAVLDDGALVIASHATGHITVADPDGTIVRTLDTGTGAGLGGLTVRDGVVYFVQMTERRVYRIDVE